jgi:hypothetical protein
VLGFNPFTYLQLSFIHLASYLSKKRSMESNMNSVDVLYFSLAATSLVLAGFTSWAIYHIVQILKEIKLILRDTQNMTHDLTNVKDALKFGFSRFISRKH